MNKHVIFSMLLLLGIMLKLIKGIFDLDFHMPLVLVTCYNNFKANLYTFFELWAYYK